MSESESVALHSSEDSSAGASEYVLPQIERAVEREGLPRTYRMRADAHYVDQLESPAPPVIRLLAVSQIESTDLPAAATVDALTKSIRVHGVLQPLLIRRHAGRYSLIAGRKRLAAAIAAGLSAVPCVLHDIEASAVAAVAAAENLRADDAARVIAAEKHAAQAVMQALNADLTTIRTSLTLLKNRPQRGLAQKVASDLIEAQAARAEWIVGCIAATFDNTRPAFVAAIVQRVADAFSAYTTLTGLQLDIQVTPAAATWKLPEDAALAVIKGAVFATLSMIEGGTAPRIELHADSTLRGALRIDVVQRVAPVSHQPEHDPIVALALRTARAVVEPHGGSAELSVLPGQGSQLQISFAA